MLTFLMKIQYNVKIDKPDICLMQKISRSRGNDVSDFIRLSIKKELARLGFLSKDDARALEVLV